MKRFFWTILCLAYPLTGRCAAFQNGSFESPRPTLTQAIANSKNPFAFNPSGSDATGWKFTGNCGVFTGKGSFQSFGPVDGYQQINFNGGNTLPDGLVQQTFDTVAGTAYAVGFWAGRTSSGGDAVSVTVRALATPTSATAIAEKLATPAAGAGYTPYKFTFTAQGTSTTLQIKDTSGGLARDVDIVVDAVSVYPVTQVAAPTAPTVVPFAVAASVVGDVGSLYRIDVADQLTADPAKTDWHVLTFVYLPASPYVLLDPESTVKSSRFYRLTFLTASTY